MSGINVHFFLLTRPKEMKVCRSERRQSNCGLQLHTEKNNTIELGRLKSLNV